MRPLLPALLVLLCLGCGSPPAPPDPTPTPVSTTPPAPSPSPAPSPTPTVDRAAVQKAVEASARQFPGRAGIVWRHVASGAQATVGATESFEAASLVKLPILVELFRRVEAGELDLAHELVFEEEFRVGGSGVLKDRPEGVKVRLDELARLMIVESDNAATDMLLEELGPDRIEAAMQQLGLRDTTVRRRIFDFEAIDEGRDNLTSPADMARLLELIARDEVPGAKSMREILAGQKRKDMIPAGLPPGTPVAHKTGELTGVLHDAGLVTSPGGDYILVLMGQEFSGREEAIRAWADASRRLWKAGPRQP